MTELILDFETRSEIDLLRRGAYVYAMHPSTDALLASYCIDRGPLRRWRRGEPCPEDLREHILAGKPVRGHNVAFERLIFTHVMGPKHDWPVPALEQFHCTAVTAAAMSLPRSLDRLGAALELPIQKDKRGRALMKIHSIPQGFAPDGTAIWHRLANDPTSLAAYHDYCDDDVRTELAAERRLVPLSKDEQECYWLNERINDRGLRIDVQSARAAVELAEKAKERINRELREVTGWRVDAVTQASRLLAWVREQGVEIESLDKDTIDELLHECDDVPERVRRALELRQEGAKPSVEKIAAMLDRCCPDGRARGVYLHHGAGQTGRFSSRGVQAHNMPKYRKVFEDAKPRLSTLFKVIRTADPDAVEWLYGPSLGRPLHLLSDAVRSFIWAAPGHDLIDVDYTSIEGVLAAWFAKEEWKLDAFRALIAGTGPGMYELTAAGIYGIPVEKVDRKVHRPTGKVAELSCLAADTVVVTDNGAKAIAEVSLSDRLWDGVEWVSHDGVVARGVRRTVDVDGIRLTADHSILTGAKWMPAGHIVSSSKSLSLALASGLESLRSWRLNTGRMAGSEKSRCNALAPHPRISSTFQTSAAGVLRAAVNAPRLQASHDVRNTTATPTSSLTPHTAVACSIASPRASAAAQTPMIPGFTTTGLGVSPWRGAEIGASFWRTLSRWRGGTRQLWSLIESMSRGATNPATCALLAMRRTSGTNGNLARCKSKSTHSEPKTNSSEPVFDILNCGPRQRFTVLSRSGALIVHNCQYQTGVSGIRKFARANKVDLPALFPALWATATAEQREMTTERFHDRERAHDPNTTVLGWEGWAAAELIKLGWRAKHPAITGAWRLVEDAAVAAVRDPGSQHMALGVTYKVARGFLWARLPSGRCLAYGAPRMQETEAPWADKTLPEEKREKKMSLTVLGTDAQTERWVRFPIYGGSLYNNLTQGSARDILVHGMKNAEAAGYKIVLHTHDEMAAEMPRGVGSVEELKQIVTQLPDWCRGLPLMSAGWRGKRYRKD